MYFEMQELHATAQSQEMEYLLEILPANLKILLVKFIHKSNIEAIPFLRNKPDTFYLSYLDKLMSMRFEKDDLIFEKGQKPREIFFITKGVAVNVQDKRKLTKGTLLGADDILFKRDRVNTIMANEECITLRMDREVFERMIKSYPDIRSLLMENANDRASLARMSKMVLEAVEPREQKKIVRIFNQLN